LCTSQDLYFVERGRFRAFKGRKVCAEKLIFERRGLEKTPVFPKGNTGGSRDITIKLLKNLERRKKGEYN